MNSYARVMLVACAVAVAACSNDSPDLTSPMKLPDNLKPREVVLPRDDYRRGIYYFAGWEDVPTSSPLSGLEWPFKGGTQWDLIAPWSRTPTYGFVSDNSQSIADQHIQQMASAGFTWVAYQTGWSPDLWRSGGSTAALYMKYALKNHISSVYTTQLKFAVTWHNVHSSPWGGGAEFWSGGGWTATQYSQNMEAMFRAWFVEYANASSDYYKISGRPVFVFWAPQDLENVPSGFASPQGVISILNQVASEYGYSGDTRPYLIATAIPESKMVAAAGWGFDAVSGYVYYPAIHNYSDIRATYSWHWQETLNTIANTSLKYFVPTVAGIDQQPWNGPNYGEPTSSEFEAHIEDAKTKALQNASKTDMNIITCCWNEFGEGPYLQPTQEKGTMFIDTYYKTIDWIGPPIRY